VIYSKNLSMAIGDCHLAIKGEEYANTNLALHRRWDFADSAGDSPVFEKDQTQPVVWVPYTQDDVEPGALVPGQ
jgi:hypothetical protein